MLIQEVANAMRMHLTTDAVTQSIYVHPALPEVVQRAFGELGVRDLFAQDAFAVEDAEHVGAQAARLEREVVAKLRQRGVCSVQRFVDRAPANLYAVRPDDHLEHGREAELDQRRVVRHSTTAAVTD
ncbi:MAG: hypothetical protein ACE1ZN_05370 [Dehalococcoidia bacterium]